MRFDTVTLLPVLLGSLLPAAVHSRKLEHRVIPDHVLRVSIADVPSACESRQNVVVNGTSPGPAIRVLPGTRSWIRVYNDMDDWNLTMHWHGLTQHMAPFADGTPAVSQWPIPPGHFFDYEISPALDDAGSYFYHSHVDMQALSCTGPLIVEDCGSAPYHYDDERILLFQDYFQESDDELMENAHSTSYQPTETRGILLNGKGVALGAQSVEGPPGEANGFFGSHRSLESGEFNGPSDFDDGACYEDDWVNDCQITPRSDCTLPVIDVEPGKTYRFRFIASTGMSFIKLGFEDHNQLTIIQVDGSEYTYPVTVDHLQIGSGQRLDVLFTAKTEEELRWSGKKTYFLQFETRDRPEVYRGYGVLRYKVNHPVPAAPRAPILDLPMDPTNWLEYTFQPLFPEKSRAPTTEEVTRRVILEAEQTVDPDTGRVVYELAHMSWTDGMRDKPVLVDIYERGQAAIPNYEAALANHG